MKKTNLLFDLQLEWLQTQYDFNMKNAKDRFMTNAFFYLSNLENNISKNIDDANTLFEALKIYDDFCITTILQAELKNTDIRIANNLWELVDDALAQFYGDDLEKKKEVEDDLINLIYDAQMKYLDKHKTNGTALGKQLDDYINELFRDYEYKQDHYRVKSLDEYKSLLSEIINSYKINDNDLSIVILEQRYIVKPFNMWSVLEARQIIASFTLIHLFKITDGEIEKIKKLLTSFQNEYSNSSRFHQEILYGMKDYIKSLTGLILDKNEVTSTKNDYEAKYQKLEKEKKIIEKNFALEMKYARLDKESKESKANRRLDNKEALMRLRLSAKDKKTLEHQSTHNQELLSSTYSYVLKELEYEYYGVFEPLIDKSKLLSASSYLEKIQSYHDAYVLITDGIFTDPKQSKAMHEMKHNFSFLYECMYEYPYGGKEEYIFSEYASALSSGWMLQAIMSNFDLIESDDIKSSLLKSEFFATLHKYENYALCYPLVYLYKMKLIGITEAFKIAEKLLGQLTKRKNFKDESFEKNFKILCTLLTDFNLDSFIRENASLLFTD